MSEDSTTPPPVDLSGLQIMPTWVNQLGQGTASSWEDHPAARAEERGGDRRRDGQRGSGRGRDERGFGGGGQRGERKDFRDRREGGGPPRDRRDGGKGGFGGQRQDGRRDDRGGERRDFRDQRPPPLPEGITAAPEPDEKAVDALASHVRATKHAFSVFEASKLLLGHGGRYRIRLSVEEDKPSLWRVPADGSVWRTRDEAISHVFSSPVIGKYYRAVEVAREAPRGSFTSVAVCGFSGELIGPPNHHSYQPTVARLHREKFANLPMDAYRRRIRVEHDAALVEKWLDSQRKAIEWIWLKDPAARPAEQASESPLLDAADTGALVESLETNDATDPAQPVGESPETETTPLENPPVEGSETVDEVAPNSGTAGMTTAETSDEAPAESLPIGMILKTRAEMEAHFRTHHADRVLKEIRHAAVPGDIAPSSIQADLLRLVRITADIARSRPFAMTQKLCGAFERRGLKIFKRRGGKLFVSTARPKALDPDVTLSDGVRALVEKVKSTPGIKVPQLLEAIAPQPGDATELTPERRQAMQDLHWLAESGYLIEFSDGVVTLGVQGEKRDSGKETGKHKDDNPSGETEAPQAAGTSPETTAPTAEIPVEAIETPETPEPAPEAHPQDSSEPSEPFEPTTPRTSDL